MRMARRVTAFPTGPVLARRHAGFDGLRGIYVMLPPW
jgi:hypothetical protein